MLDLRQRYGIYMPVSGRINIAGLEHDAGPDRAERLRRPGSLTSAGRRSVAAVLCALCQLFSERAIALEMPLPAHRLVASGELLGVGRTQARPRVGAGAGAGDCAAPAGARGRWSSRHRTGSAEAAVAAQQLDDIWDDGLLRIVRLTAHRRSVDQIWRNGIRSRFVVISIDERSDRRRAGEGIHAASCDAGRMNSSSDRAQNSEAYCARSAF